METNIVQHVINGKRYAFEISLCSSVYGIRIVPLIDGNLVLPCSGIVVLSQSAF